MPWIRVADDAEVEEGRLIPIDVEGKELVLLRYRGRLHVIDRRCYHLMGDLSRGVLKNGELTCPRCGSVFNVKTGKNIMGPKIGVIRMRGRDERAYDVKVDGGAVYVRVD